MLVYQRVYDLGSVGFDLVQTQRALFNQDFPSILSKSSMMANGSTPRYLSSKASTAVFGRGASMANFSLDRQPSYVCHNKVSLMRMIRIIRMIRMIRMIKMKILMNWSITSIHIQYIYIYILYHYITSITKDVLDVQDQEEAPLGHNFMGSATL